MCGLCDISEVTQHAYHSVFFIVHLVILLIFCNAGKADIVVYEGTLAIAEFPDTELSYTQSIKRNGIEGVLIASDPLHACTNVSRPPDINGSLNWFILMSGNFCTFETKVRNARLAGYTLGIIYSYKARVENFSKLGHYRFYSDMPAVVVETEYGLQMKENFLFDDNMRFFQQSSTVHNGRLSYQHLRRLQTTTYQKGDLYETCAICLEDYKDHDKLRILPCSHGYHMKCIDPWLTNNRRICPVCKRKVLMGGETSSSQINQNFDETENTPLLRGSRVGPRSAFSYSESTPVNTPHISFPSDQVVVVNVHSTSDTSLPSGRHPEEQDVLHSQ